MEAYGLDNVLEELKKRGIEAGKTEADAIVSKAKEEAAAILDKAKQEADTIRKEAQTEAEKLRHQMDAELRSAAESALAAFRQALLKSFILPTVSQEVEKVFSKPDFMEHVILEAVKGFLSTQRSDLELILPEKMKDALEGMVVKRIQAKTGAKLTATYEGLRFGFQLRGGALELDFSNNAFDELFAQFVGGRFKKYFHKNTGEKAQGPSGGKPGK